MIMIMIMMMINEPIKGSSLNANDHHDDHKDGIDDHDECDEMGMMINTKKHCF